MLMIPQGAFLSLTISFVSVLFLLRIFCSEASSPEGSINIQQRKNLRAIRLVLHAANDRSVNQRPFDVATCSVKLYSAFNEIRKKNR